MRIGVDVGGTNTDAVLLDGRTVLAEHKATTTPDVTAGIAAALRGLGAAHAFEPAAVSAVMIGTTHFTNAVVENRDLTRVAAIRIGLPATAALPPLTDWPPGLRAAIGGHTYLCRGGFEFDGRRIADLDEDAVRRAAEDAAGQGVGSVAIACVFSPVNAEMEARAAEIVVETVPGAAVSLSHEIGRIGLLERENATVLNACLRGLADRITGALDAAVRDVGIAAPLYISQNDGTLMDAKHCRRYPVATFTSGPTNSMRGAAFLSGEADCVVIDVGGTTSDVGVLGHGFPREAAAAVQIGGVRTNFRMPDVLSVGLGGGSLVATGNGSVRVGPRSVGYRITDQALVFGGDILTATDLAVAGGLCEVGDAARVRHLDRSLVDEGLARIRSGLEELVDRVKTRAGDVPVVVVGGGSVLVQGRMAGAARVVKPDHLAVANAIGAALAQVGGEVDRIFSLGNMGRQQALDEARQEAVDRARAGGANAGSIQIVDVEEVPLAYLPGNAIRIRVKAVGDLDLEVSNAARA